MKTTTTVRVEDSHLRPPVLTHNTRTEEWCLHEAYRFAKDGHDITIPEGFLFDLASIPRFFWRFVAPFELSIVAPLLHDFLYRYAGQPPAGTVGNGRTYSRSDADHLFRHVMKLEGVPSWRRNAAFRAVRMFGGGAWGSKQITGKATNASDAAGETPEAP